VKALIACPLAKSDACKAAKAEESNHSSSVCTSSYDLTIAVDGGTQWFQQRNITPDFAVGDFDSIGDSTFDWLLSLEQSAATQIKRVPSDKDFSDLELALSICEQQKVQSVTIIGASGGRIDHQLCVLGAIQNSTIPDITLQGEQMVRLLRSGQTATIGAQTFSLISLSGATVSIKDARWPLDRATLQPLSAQGLSNQSLSDVSATVTVHEGAAFLIYTMFYEVHGNSKT